MHATFSDILITIIAIPKQRGDSCTVQLTAEGSEEVTFMISLLRSLNNQVSEIFEDLNRDKKKPIQILAGMVHTHPGYF
jgi:hypothetical protein